MLVMLRPTRVGPFRRTLRDGKGAVKDRIRFERGKPMKLSRLQLAAVEQDLKPGGALVAVKLDGKGRPRVIDTGEPANPAEEPAKLQATGAKPSQPIPNTPGAEAGAKPAEQAP